MRLLRAAPAVLLFLAISLAASASAQTNSCSAQGLSGSCNSCVCCCYAASAGFVTYTPSDSCTCNREVDSSRVNTTVVISVMVVFAALLASLYFSGSLCAMTPFPRNQRLVSTMLPPLTATHHRGY
ncbi:hypothetical protein ACKKBG_A28715 [Auxenochlorella protothecoides x Auxenochlorella symbiontica]